MRTPQWQRRAPCWAAGHYWGVLLWRCGTRRGCRTGGADYVAFGTPFPSPTKSTKRTDISIGIFQEAKRQVHVPVFAIGGITIANAQQIIDAGADGVAIVSGVFGAPDVEAAARALAQLF